MRSQDIIIYNKEVKKSPVVTVTGKSSLLANFKAFVHIFIRSTNNCGGMYLE